jgi:hypothetical protein
VGSWVAFDDLDRQQYARGNRKLEAGIQVKFNAKDRTHGYNGENGDSGDDNSSKNGKNNNNDDDQRHGSR